MNKVAPIVAVVILAGAVAVVVYFATRTTKPVDPPVNGEVTVKNETFDFADFMTFFDENGDGKVLFEEFNHRYGNPEFGDPPFVFTEKDGAPPFTAAEAFKKWDRNRNGHIDAEDIRLIGDKALQNHIEDAAKRGLHVVEWEGRRLELNEQQKTIFNDETGAEAQGTLPFAGTFWKAEHLTKARWARVNDGATDVYGYVSEHNGRLYILTETAELLVKDPAKVEIAEFPADDPHMLYAAEIANTRFNNVEKNLALARKCAQWGMKIEARMLYARVLLFQRDNQEALDAFGYRLEGEHYKAKGE